MLRRIPNDIRWVPVVVNDGGWACFTHIHPECLQYLPSGADRVIMIGHHEERGHDPPTHDLGALGQEPVRYLETPSGNLLVPDARWDGEHGVGNCKGYCYAVVAAMVRNRERMADILDFASHRASGVVACNRATHRSVAAGKILELLFNRNVNYRYASRDNCRCNQPARHNLNGLYTGLRSLSQPYYFPPLAQQLHLPW